MVAVGGSAIAAPSRRPVLSGRSVAGCYIDLADGSATGVAVVAVVEAAGAVAAVAAATAVASLAAGRWPSASFSSRSGGRS